MSGTAAGVQLERYTIDPRGSRLTIRAFATGVLSAMGHNPVIAARDISGEIRFARGTLDAAEVRIRIPTAGLAAQNDMSDTDRRDMERTMRDDVLATATYPEVVFEGSRARIEQEADGRLRVDLDGDLTVRGVTRPQRVSGQAFLTGDMLRAQGEFRIRQTDFGIRPVSVAAGALKVKDEITCTFDLVARKGEG
jgi:polyisoprenoid-binding protein YceI